MLVHAFCGGAGLPCRRNRMECIRWDAGELAIRRAEDPFQRLRVEALVAKQLAREAIQQVTMFLHDGLGARIAFVQQSVDLIVDRIASALGIIALLAYVAAKENHLLLAAERHRPQPLAHAPFLDHAPYKGRRARDVIARAGAQLAEHNGFSRVAGQCFGDRVVELTARHVHSIFGRQEARGAGAQSARNDRDLVHRIVVRQEPRDDRMAALVIRGQLLLARRNHVARAFRPSADTVDGLFELEHADRVFVASRRQNGALVQHVGQVGAREADSLARQHVEGHTGVQWLSARMHVQNSLTSTKTMHGACFLASVNRSRTRPAPTPTNISTNSEPEMLKNCTFASPATARANSVLPVPGGPTSRTPRGIRAPSSANLSGSLRNSTISSSSWRGSSTPATSLNVIPLPAGATTRARLRPKDRTELPVWPAARSLRQA